MARKLIFGLGYLGARVAKRWRSVGHDVYAVTRSAERARELAAMGVIPRVANILDASTLDDLPESDTILFAVGYDRASVASIETVYVEGIQNVLRAVERKAGRLIYVSSTGVYGDAAGAWIDETSPCSPSRPGGRASLNAERALAASSLAGRSFILRMAGLYGPGRIPRIAELREGRAIAVPTTGQERGSEGGWLNLIHVEDAARIVVAADEWNESGSALAGPARPRAEPITLVVSDGTPVDRREYFRELARLLGAPSPSFVPPDADSPAALRAADDKRVNPARLRALLGGALLYPSYREGLAASLADR